MTSPKILITHGVQGAIETVRTNCLSLFRITSSSRKRFSFTIFKAMSLRRVESLGSKTIVVTGSVVPGKFFVLHSQSIQK